MENPKPQEVKDVKKKELSEDDLKNVAGGAPAQQDMANNLSTTADKANANIDAYIRS
jgi:bacteriocin-like protein